MTTAAIIPARFASTRFPGKPLAIIGGKPMIQRVYEQAMACPELSEVWVATDDDRIKNAVEAFGGKVVMTSPNCLSGTDRCAEVLQKARIKSDIIINIQGDEPFIQPSQISQLIRLMVDTKAEIGTLCKSISDNVVIQNPNVVKVVKATNGKALYFSRHAVPFVRGFERKIWSEHAEYWKHLGMYAYRSEVLPKISKLPVGKLETAESLEQLRWLEAGYSIYVAESQNESIGIDTPEDLMEAEIFWQKSQLKN